MCPDDLNSLSCSGWLPLPQHELKGNCYQYLSYETNQNMLLYVAAILCSVMIISIHKCYFSVHSHPTLHRMPYLKYHLHVYFVPALTI